MHNQGPFRNATTTTIAPTGTLSILAGYSSSVEPLFALSFVRQIMDGERLVESNPWFEKALHDAQCHSPKLMEEVAAKGSIAHLDYLPEKIRRGLLGSGKLLHARSQGGDERQPGLAPGLRQGTDLPGRVLCLLGMRLHKMRMTKDRRRKFRIRETKGRGG